MNINENFLKIESSYLFSNIAKKVKAYTKANPDKEIIRLGIGDVTRPLAPAALRLCTRLLTKWPTKRRSAAIRRSTAMISF